MDKNNHYPIAKIKIIVVIVFIASLLSLPSFHALAQDYSFSLDEETVHVYWNADGTLSIDYVFVFTNDAGASPIDFVDVGFPNNNYNIANISAEIDGQTITDIQDSPYVTYGVALGLDAKAIQPGATGTVHVFVDTIENPYYIDYNDDTYASFQFSPTWFGSEFVSGDADISVTFHLPPGVQPAEPRWHSAPFSFPEEPTTGLDDEGRIIYTWHNPKANGHTQYVFGASIPRQYVLSTFWLETETHHIYLNADGSIDVDIEFKFHNHSQAASLSNLAVDIPYRAYEIVNPSADVDGTPVQDLYASYSDINMQLGESALQPGEPGTIHLAYTLVDQPYSSSWWDEEYQYASFEYRTTDFDQSWTAGVTEFTAVFHIPGNTNIEDIAWEQDYVLSETPSQNVDSQGRTTLTWHNPKAIASDSYDFKINIPREFIAAEAIYDYAKPSLLARMGIDEDAFFGCLCMSGFFAVFIGIIALGVRSSRKRKMKYLPPKVRIEGHGIKRGLMAVEAAILMEHPADKVLTMILFAVLKKDAATVVSRDPLKLDVTQPIDEKLRYYERDFLQAFASDNRKERKQDLQKLMIKLIKNVGKRMKGFSHKETVAYYKSIMRKAWQQIEAADTPEVRSQQYDEHMGWTMLDKDFDKRTQDVFRSGPVYVPVWWHRYDPTWSRPSASTVRPSAAKPTTAPASGTGRSAPTTPSMPQLPGGEFAASVVTGMQGFASDVVGNVTSFTDRITNKTNPVPKSTSSGRSWSGGSGGSSCACACACAGCACACAGGGR